MRIKILFLVLFIAAFGASAQDLIILRNNTNIKAKVLEVAITEIKYKKFDNLEGPVYSILKSEVFMIKYANGTTDIFTEPAAYKKDSSAQIYSERKKLPTRILIYGGVSIPWGNFAELSEGGAETGWALGIFTSAPLQNGRPGFFHFQLSYAEHPYDFTAASNGNYDLSGSYSIWHVFVGIGGRTQAKRLAGYMNILLGANYVTVDGALADAGYSDAFSFSMSTGAGAIIANKFIFGIKYMYSKPTFINDHSTYIKTEQIVSILQVTAGLEF